MGDSWERYNEMEQSSGLGVPAEPYSPETKKNIEGQYTRSVFLPVGACNKKKNDFEEAGFGLSTPSTAALLGGGRFIIGDRRRSAAPQIDMPQRVGHPTNVKAPARMAAQNRDESILKVFGSADPEKRKNKSNKSYTQNNNTSISQLKDLAILSKTCRRAGKAQQEAQVNYSRGVLYDNLEMWGKAIDAYECYLDLCGKLGDKQGACVAFNCLGVAYFNLACDGSQAASRAVGLLEDGATKVDLDDDFTIPLETKEVDSKYTNYLETALAYHEKHFESSDESGRYVALVNVGLCYSRLGDYEKAIDFHQQALRLAIDLKTSHGQSLAVGNLALASAELGDWETSKACMDKHLHLVRDLQNFEAESLACQQLGQIANKHGHYTDAVRYFEEARKIASESGERGMLKLLNCNLGVTQGNLRMEEYMRRLSHGLNDE